MRRSHRTTASRQEQSGGKGGVVLPAHGSQAMLDIIQGFVKSTKGTVTNTTQDFEASVTFDYTNNGSNTVIACIYGHTHVKYHKIVDGINHIATRAVYGHPTFDFVSTGNYFIVDLEKPHFKADCKRGWR